MATRYIGDAVVTIRYVGGPDDEYQGSVSANGMTWSFRSLYAPKIGFSHAYDGPEAYDKMAESAVGFASYYTSHNRGDDLPEWAPVAEVADAISEAASWAQDEQGDYKVLRRKPRAEVSHV